MLLCLFSVGQLLLCMQPILKRGLFPQWDSLGANLISLCKWLPVGERYRFRNVGMCSLFPSALEPHLVQIQAGPVHTASVFVSLHVHWSYWFRGLCFLVVLHFLWILYYFLLLLHRVSCALIGEIWWKRALYYGAMCSETFYVEQAVIEVTCHCSQLHYSLSSCTIFSVVSAYLTILFFPQRGWMAYKGWKEAFMTTQCLHFPMSE